MVSTTSIPEDAQLLAVPCLCPALFLSQFEVHGKEPGGLIPCKSIHEGAIMWHMLTGFNRIQPNHRSPNSIPLESHLQTIGVKHLQKNCQFLHPSRYDSNEDDRRVDELRR
jgi:hypothetical protein